MPMVRILKPSRPVKNKYQTTDNTGEMTGRRDQIGMSVMSCMAAQSRNVYIQVRKKISIENVLPITFGVITRTISSRLLTLLRNVLLKNRYCEINGIYAAGPRWLSQRCCQRLHAQRTIIGQIYHARTLHCIQLTYTRTGPKQWGAD